MPAQEGRFRVIAIYGLNEREDNSGCLRVQHRQHKKEEEELEAKAGYLKEKGAKLGGWFGKKAEEAKDVAIDAKVSSHICSVFFS
jgi:hypothetical protein